MRRWRLGVGGLDGVEMGAGHRAALLAQEHGELEDSAGEEFPDDVAEVRGLAADAENPALPDRRMWQTKKRRCCLAV